MDKTLMVCFFLGLVMASALGVLFSRRIVLAGFSLFGMLLAVAGVFATLGVHSATFTQVVLYVGGVMVLVVFALFLNPDPGNALSKWKTVKQNLGKAFILCTGLVWISTFVPFRKINAFFISESDGTEINGPLAPGGGPELSQTIKIISHPSLTGRELATTFGPEFEIVGLLLLAAIVLAGWYLKTQNEAQNK